MSIDLDSFPLPLYDQFREGPEPNQERKQIRLTLVWLALEPWAGRPGLSLLFCSRHDKDARKRYAQRVEDPLRVSVVSVGNSTIFSPIVLKKKGKCYGPLLFDPILTGDEPRLP